MKGLGLPATDRVHALVDTFAFDCLKTACNFEFLRMTFSEKKALLKNCYIDISQNPRYQNPTSPTAACLCTGTVFYSFGLDRVLLPEEHLLLQGHSRGFRLPDSMRQASIRSLAGEGICLPCLGTVVWAMYLVKGLP